MIYGQNMEINRFKYVLLLSLIVFCSCSVNKVPTLMTPKGVENYVESNKRIVRENKAIKKHHDKERRRIKRLQNIKK